MARRIPATDEMWVRFPPAALLSEKEEQEFREELRERFLESITPDEEDEE